MPEYNNILQATSVMVCTGCPLDRSYNHTILFSSRQEQYSYFYSLHHIMLTNTLNKQSFQRASRNSIRVEAGQWRLMHSNYLVFINENMGGKYYYAFIDDTVYINPNTTEIFYTIDVMQTWMFDYILRPCFVEREHSVHDYYGENLLAEPVDLGPYYVGLNTKEVDQGGYVLAIASTCTLWYETLDHGETHVTGKKNNNGTMYGGVPTAVAITYYDLNHLTTDYNASGSETNPDPWNMYPNYGRPSFKHFIDWAVTMYGEDVIVGAYILPAHACVLSSQDTSPSSTNKVYTLKPFTDLSDNAVDIETGMSSAYAWNFVAHNKKLYTFPYCYLDVFNGEEEKVYNFEAFDFYHSSSDYTSNIITLLGRLTPTPDSASLFIPQYYKGQTENRQESIIISNYPMLSINVDSFKAWWAQNRGKVLASMTGTLLSGATNAFTGMNSAVNNINFWGDMPASSKSAEVHYGLAKNQLHTTRENSLAGMVGGELNNVVSGIIAGAQAGSLANHIIGNQNGTIQYKGDLLTLRYTPKFIMPYYAKMVDEFFDMFGYATKRVKVPNTNSRPYWNYVKTRNCHVDASDPAENIGLDAVTEETINGIYDKGITFWKYRQDMVVCDYSKDNRPT